MNHCMRLALLACLLHSTTYIDRAIAARDVLARPIKATCDNTKAGRHYLADSAGYVCPRSAFDYPTGCCSAGEQFTCDTCHLADKCCSSYEHCVSCCLAPKHGAQDAAVKQFRIHGHDNTGRWASAFEFCAGKCRTHVASTTHENSFIDDRHFCFSDTGRPQVVENPPAVPPGVTVVPSEKGTDCITACQDRGLLCDVIALRSINHCDAMRAHFACEAGCAESAARAEAPAYVVYGSSKPLFPTMCFVGVTADRLACGGSQPHLRRLCACAPTG